MFGLNAVARHVLLPSPQSQPTFRFLRFRFSFIPEMVYHYQHALRRFHRFHVSVFSRFKHFQSMLMSHFFFLTIHSSSQIFSLLNTGFIVAKPRRLLHVFLKSLRWGRGDPPCRRSSRCTLYLFVSPDISHVSKSFPQEHPSRFSTLHEGCRRHEDL